MFFRTKITITILTILISIIVLNRVHAWVEPTTNPPGNNIVSPLNSSAFGQSKTSGLILNLGKAVNGLIVKSGLVGVGTDDPQATLDVAGKIKGKGLKINSSSEGVLLPRTTPDKVSNPEEGSLIYNTAESKFSFYTPNDGWESIEDVVTDERKVVEYAVGEGRLDDFYCKKKNITAEGMQEGWTNINEGKTCGSDKWCRVGNCSLCGVDFYSNGSSCIPVGVGKYSPDNNNNLYNCTNKPPDQALPTGGTITYSGDYIIHTFTGSGTFTPGTNNTKVEVLVVAGGGGGGGFFNGNVGRGGGGAGGLIYNSNFSVTPGQSISVTVGEGGAGGQSSNGVNGGNSAFGSLLSTGGGGGGNWNSRGNNGGSGGGAGYSNTEPFLPGGLGILGQGSNGGTGDYSPGYNCGIANNSGAGGGGAGALGGNGYPQSGGGAGGIGLQYDISGNKVYYAGGGGGSGTSFCAFTSGGSGGLGGGGAGASCPSNGPYSGTPNTGGGGGGGSCGSTGRYIGWNGAPGGSGIVIVRYPKYVPFSATYTSSGGGANGCDWSCSSGLIRSGSTCIYRN